MSEIGGYFELELRKDEEYHKEAIRLNSGRNAIEYVLRARGYKKVYLPYYSCEVMLEPFNKLKLEYEFYPINEQLEPIFNFNRIGANEMFLYINYFGIKSNIVQKLTEKCSNLLIDNSQAFFEKPLSGIDTFYSPRKFFGVPDGAYLFTDKLLTVKLLRDKSVVRFSHLIKRIDDGAEDGYADFKANDDDLKEQPIKLMSSLTQALLCNIDYDNVIKTRKQNFRYLYERLHKLNEFKFPIDNDFVPIAYPFLTPRGKSLKQKLIQNKIFVPTYWPKSEKGGDQYFYEEYLIQNLLPIPIDQRYTIREIKTVLELIDINV